MIGRRGTAIAVIVMTCAFVWGGVLVLLGFGGNLVLLAFALTALSIPVGWGIFFFVTALKRLVFGRPVKNGRHADHMPPHERRHRIAEREDLIQKTFAAERRASAEVVGTAVFRIEPSFSPTSVFRFEYLPDSIRITALMVPGFEDTYYGQVRPTVLEQHQGTVVLRDAPEILRTWDELLSSAEAAINCETTALDGIGYTLRVADSQRTIQARWDNPDEKLHRPQSALITAFEGCVRKAGLAKFLI
ncbi:MAG TPA: hypothetical protein VMZ92_15590 [Planctomycetota bacterium]|nr:hypothetical protein [Planctomycetota bacterium]